MLACRLARHDIVLTTYGVVRSESAGLAGASFKDKGEPQPSKKKDSEQGSSASFEVIDTYSGSDEEYVPPSKSGIKTAIKSTSKCTWPLFKVLVYIQARCTVVHVVPFCSSSIFPPGDLSFGRRNF